MRPRDIGWVYRTSSAGMLDSPPDQSCDEVYHTRNSQREKRPPLSPAPDAIGALDRAGSEGRNDADPGPPPRFADGAARPLATHEPLESLRLPAIVSAKTLVGAVLEWPPRRGFP